MTDLEIAKLAVQLSATLVTKEDLKNFATKEDFKELKEEFKQDIKALETKLSSKIDELNEKSDTILSYASLTEEEVDKHEKLLKKITAIPIIKNALSASN